jgi:hypothetical protein
MAGAPTNAAKVPITARYLIIGHSFLQQKEKIDPNFISAKASLAKSTAMLAKSAVIWLPPSGKRQRNDLCIVVRVIVGQEQRAASVSGIDAAVNW